MKVENLQKTIGYRFINPDLLRQALTHGSFASENNTDNNERLEFLGDSLLNAVIAEHLFNQNPDFDEGHLSKARSRLVNNNSLCSIAKKLNIGKSLFLGKGEKKTNGAQKDSNLCNALEAVIGAVFLDSNYETTKKLILSIYSDDIKNALTLKNYKGSLQEFCEKKYSRKPRYKVVLQEGLQHQKIFTIEAWIDAKLLGKGVGKSKRQAEQSAAKQALENIHTANLD